MSRCHSLLRTIVNLVALVLATVTPVFSRPASENLPGDNEVELYTLPPLEVPQDNLAFSPTPPKDEPLVIALPNVVSITPDTNGNWDTADDGTQVWRLHVEAPGATGAIVGFTKYNMPEGGELYIYSNDGNYILPPFTSADNTATGELWLPLVPKNDIVLEVNLPEDTPVDSLELEIGAINGGFRSNPLPGRELSGSCNNDVVCSVGDDWRKEIRSVAGYGWTPGAGQPSLFCTGAMINNVEKDQTPYFLTAYHCISSPSDASSISFYWNYETSTCGGNADGALTQATNGGAILRAANSNSDFTLLELNNAPDPSFGVTYAGWDNSGEDATSAVGIHHPRGDEKRISFENDATTTTNYLNNGERSDRSHVRVIDWDDGTTEPGSSGSPLFNQNHHIIGQLHGGYAACSNSDSDWYGKFSRSWNDGGSSASRLRDWLDPQSTGVTTLNLLDPGDENPAPPPPSPESPTASPTASPTGGDCTDRDDWYFRKTRKNCNWVSKRISRRCKKVGFDGTSGWDSCPVACEQC